MATISINLAGIEVGFALNDANATRIITAYTAMMTEHSANGEPVVPTPPEVVMRLAQEIVSNLASNARKWEQNHAAEHARNNVPELAISLTPL
jgi:hypothetical protein